MNKSVLCGFDAAMMRACFARIARAASIASVKRLQFLCLFMAFHAPSQGFAVCVHDRIPRGAYCVAKRVLCV